MKKSRLADRLLLLAAALLLVLLAFLTLWLISAFRQNSRTAADFDLTAAISNRNTEEDIATCLLPEFAGISVDGERLGLVGSENAMRELTRTLLQALYDNGRLRSRRYCFLDLAPGRDLPRHGIDCLYKSCKDI